MITSSAFLLGSLGAAAVGGLASYAGTASANSGAAADSLAARQFAQQERMNTQDYQYRLYKEQLSDQEKSYYERLENERAYNTPLAQAQRLREAGINPAAVGMTGAGASDNTFSAPPVISAPSVPTTGSVNQSQRFQPYNVGNMVSDTMKSVGSFLKDLAGADLSDAQKTQITALLQSQQYHAQLENTLLELEVMKKDSTLPAEIQQAFGDAWNSILTASLTGEKITTEGLTQKLLDYQGKLTNEQFLQAVKMTENMDTLIKLQNDLKREEIKTERSEQASNYADASYTNALAATENKLRDGKFELINLEADLTTLAKLSAGNDLAVSDATLEAKKVGIVNALAREGIITEQARQELVSKAKQAEWADKMAYMQYWTGFFNAASGAIGSVSQASGVYLNRLSAKERNQAMTNFNDAWERVHSGTKVGYYRDDNGWQPSWKTELK